MHKILAAESEQVYDRREAELLADGWIADDSMAIEVYGSNLLVGAFKKEPVEVFSEDFGDVHDLGYGYVRATPHEPKQDFVSFLKQTIEEMKSKPWPAIGDLPPKVSQEEIDWLIERGILKEWNLEGKQEDVAQIKANLSRGVEQSISEQIAEWHNPESIPSTAIDKSLGPDKQSYFVTDGGRIIWTFGSQEELEREGDRIGEVTRGIRELSPNDYRRLVEGSWEDD